MCIFLLLHLTIRLRISSGRARCLWLSCLQVSASNRVYMKQRHTLHLHWARYMPSLKSLDLLICGSAGGPRRALQCEVRFLMSCKYLFPSPRGGEGPSTATKTAPPARGWAAGTLCTFCTGFLRHPKIHPMHCKFHEMP